MSQSRKPSFEKLEPRILFAVRTVDFNDYPISFTQFDWMLKDAHTPSSGFSYTIGTGAGQRPNVNGITWADASYYDAVLGAGGFDVVNQWNMKPLILYSDPKGDWLTQGWNYVPDMAEGHACVDDAARAAITYIDDYLANGTLSSYQTARDILTFVAYMTTRQGKTYNFAWLDAPAIFGWDPVYGQDKHFEYRVEYVRRTAYPSANPDASWFDPNSDTAHIINWPSPVRASPFMPHAKYSVYIDDLRDAGNNDVATVYDGPLYDAPTGAPSSYKTGIKKTWTNSTQAFGADEGRAIMAVARGLLMMQKREATAGLSADELAFARFLENDMNRMVRNAGSQSLGGWDSKLASMVLSGLADYYQLFYGTTEFGTYTPKLAANSNTAETGDDRPAQASVLAMIDTLASSIKSKQFRSTDWRNGIFIDDAGGGNWDAWGQLQIYALARTYRMKVNVGANPADQSVASLLDYAAYAADNFYGVEAYHYAAPGTDNVRTKERITSISGWSAKYHTNSTQIAYHNSSIVLGLEELARAYQVSDRADKATRVATYLADMKSVASWFIGNNTALLDMYDAGAIVSGTYRGRGAVFDGISPSGNNPVINRSSGGESLDEGLWAMIHIRKAIADFALSSTFSFEQGTSGAARPTVTSSTFDRDLPKPGVVFNFSQNVGASLHPWDITVINTSTNETIPTSALSLAYNSALRRLTVTFPGYHNGILPNGNWTATLNATGIVGASGNPMAANYTLEFRALVGDADGNGVVNFDDYVRIDNGFNNHLTGFSNGDFDYNGVVNFDDYVLIDLQFNNQLFADPLRDLLGAAGKR